MAKVYYAKAFALSENNCTFTDSNAFKAMGVPDEELLEHMKNWCLAWQDLGYTTVLTVGDDCNPSAETTPVDL